MTNMINISGKDDNYFIKIYRQLAECCNLPGADDETVRVVLNQFVNAYGKRLVSDNKGGAGEYPSAWIYLIVKLFNPNLIVESGVWKGHTSWLLRQACPETEIHSFDISLGMLECKLEDVSYYEHDWMSNNVIKNIDINARSLVFIDDHVNQCKRINEAYNMGFKYVLFDDNLPVIDNTYNDGRPACPTLQLIYSDHEYGDQITYERKGKRFIYEYLEKDVYHAKKYINNYYVIPDTYTCLTLVELAK